MSRTLRISTLNLFNYIAPPNAFYQFNSIYTAEEWQHKQNWIERHVRELAPDVIAFQEVFSPEALQAQMMSLGFSHFACVSSPKIEQGYIYSSPPVAIASRHPILFAKPVEPSERLQTELAGRPFEFSRAPLHACIELPYLGAIDVYTVHLKSQRSSIEQDADQSTRIQWQDEVMGRWLSSMQRGLEAHSLHNYIVSTRDETKRPNVLLGDFNKDLASSEFDAFRSRQIFRQSESVAVLSPYHLHDSWDATVVSKDKGNVIVTETGDGISGGISDGKEQRIRPATHYSGAKGNQLDHILVSEEFCYFSANHLGKIMQYQVGDKHLINPNFQQDKQCSDHASVTIEILVD